MMRRKQLLKRISDLEESLLDAGINAAVYKRKCEKLQQDIDALNAVLDVTVEEKNRWEKLARKLDKMRKELREQVQ